MEVIYEVHRCLKMAWYAYWVSSRLVPAFIYFGSLRGYSVGTTDDKEVLSMPGGMIFIPSLVMIGSNIQGFVSEIWETVILVLLLERDFFYVCHWDDPIGHSICILSFMKIGAGIQPVLRGFLINLRVCNVGIIEEWTFMCTLLRCLHVAW